MVGGKTIQSLVEKINKTRKILPPLVKRELNETLAGSVLGIFWTIINPLLMIILYWLVFSRILKIKVHVDTGDVPFSIYLISGLMPWLMFSDSLIKGCSSILDRAYILKKVFFPAEMFPLSSVLVSFIWYCPGYFIFLVVVFILKNLSIGSIIFVIVGLGFQLVFAEGVALFLAAITTYLRDTRYIVNFLIQIMFYTSPVLYSKEMAPEKFRWMFYLNPFTFFTEIYHESIVKNNIPSMTIVFAAFCISCASLAMGHYVFRKLKKGFVDVL